MSRPRAPALRPISRAGQRPALDPESLPLASGIFAGSNLNPPLGVFNDALPDRWGRSLLLYGIPLSQRSDLVLLTRRGRSGLGSIEFIEQGTRAAPPTAESALGLDVLLDAAEKFEAGLPVEDSRLRRLLAAGTTVGGARPKATVSDGTGDWIVKFRSKILDGRFCPRRVERTHSPACAMHRRHPANGRPRRRVTCRRTDV